MSRWFSPIDVLRMATSDNAALCALSGNRNPYPGRLGVVEEGALADLLLVDGDPLSDLDLLADPDRNLLVIMKNGEIYKQQTRGDRGVHDPPLTGRMTAWHAPLVLLDGASMWFRSYFGVPSSITAPDGRPVNALRGFLDAVATVITRERPARLVVCRDDDWRPQWRVDLIPSYKAHRVAEEKPAGQPDVEEVPDDLTPQVDMIMEILDAFGIPTAGAPECEADDVLGTLAARERRDPVVVVSGDRDLLQLVRDEPVPVRVLYLGRGLAKATKCGPEEVAENLRRPVDRAGPAYAELALLRGDPSDGLPGVPGVGEKTAATLLAQHGSLEAILAAAHDPKSKMSKAYRTKLLAATDYIEAAGPVVRVATDADVSFSTKSDTLPLAAEHPRKVVKLAEEYGVTSSIGRLQKALDSCRRRLTLLGSTDLVGAVVVLERHRHLTLGAVDADLAVEGVALLHRRALRRRCT